jgi:hypothetical protein
MANSGKIGFDDSIKIINDHILGAGRLVAMHLLTVLTLTGNCVNREFLRRATLTKPTKKAARVKLFPGYEVSLQQMKTAFKGVVRKLGMTEFLVENLLCEAIRTGHGYDTFHPSQCIYFLEKDTDNILCVDRKGTVLEVRLEADDRLALDRLPNVDQVLVPRYPWWKAKIGMEGIHEWYIKLCSERNEKPQSKVMRPHNKQNIKESDNVVWNAYLAKMVELKGKDLATLVSPDDQANMKTKGKKKAKAKKQKKKEWDG